MCIRDSLQDILCLGKTRIRLTLSILLSNDGVTLILDSICEAVYTVYTSRVCRVVKNCYLAAIRNELNKLLCTLYASAIVIRCHVGFNLIQICNSCINIYNRNVCFCQHIQCRLNAFAVYRVQEYGVNALCNKVLDNAEDVYKRQEW